MKKAITALTFFAYFFCVVFLIPDCATVRLTDTQKQCLENVGISEAVVTAEEAIACNGNSACVESAAKARALITVEYAKICIDGNRDSGAQ